MELFRTERSARTRLFCCTLFVIACTTLVAAQGSARLDISKYGMVSVSTGEDLRLTADALPGGHGCRAELLFLMSTGRSAGRSLTVNLAPGTSAFDDLDVHDDLVSVVKPAAWIDPKVPEKDCAFKLTAIESAGAPSTDIAIPQQCLEQECLGHTAGSLQNSRLRIYVFAEDGGRCRAQLGFKLPQNGVSASSKYVNLISNHGDSLEWDSGEDVDVRPSDRVIPVVAFHQGDSCTASAEIVDGAASQSFSPVPVEYYESPTVGLALDPVSLPGTIDKLTAEIAKNPRNLWAISALAQAYDRQGQRERAINLLMNSLRANPKAAETWYLTAKFQFEKQDFSGARQSLAKYLELRPGDPRGLSALGATLAKLHRFDEAKRILGPLLENPSARTASVLNSWADVLSAEEQFSSALPFVEESDRLHPNCKFTLYLKATVLSGMGRIQESVAVAERVLQLDPDFMMDRVLLTQLYSKEGKTELAEQQTEWLRANFGKTRP
jgi:tetratricopeptide (TPR) repeat protein